MKTNESQSLINPASSHLTGEESAAAAVILTEKSGNIYIILMKTYMSKLVCMEFLREADRINIEFKY